MKSKFKIPDQSEAETTLGRLTIEAASLATTGNSVPAKTGDTLADCDALESFIAQAKVRTRFLQPIQPRAVAVPSSASLPATSKARAVAAPATATLSATARCLAAKGATVKPATRHAVAVPPTVPAKLPAKLTATQRAIAAKLPKIKATAPTAPAKVFVPMPANFNDPDAALRVALNDCVNSEIALQYHRVSFKRPALTGDNAADLATLAAYRIALRTTLLSITPKPPTK